MISDQARRDAEHLFRQAGYPGALTVAAVTSDDERIFVLPSEGFGCLADLRGLEAALQQVLGRKVWIVPDSPCWASTEPLR